MSTKPCRYCRKPMLWIVAPDTGAALPLDRSAPTYEQRTNLLGETVWVRSESFVSHWSVCVEREKVIADRDMHSAQGMLRQWKKNDTLNKDHEAAEGCGVEPEVEWTPPPWKDQGRFKLNKENE